MISIRFRVLGNSESILEPVLLVDFPNEKLEAKYLMFNDKEVNIIEISDAITFLNIDEKKYEKYTKKFSEIINEVLIKNKYAMPCFPKTKKEDFSKILNEIFERASFQTIAKETYFNIVNFLKERVALSDNLYYRLLAGYIYFCNAFDFFEDIKIPFLLIQGEVGSGKTTLLETLEKLIFFTKMQVNPRAPSLARILHFFRAPALIDDFRISKDLTGISEEEAEILTVIRHASTYNGAYQRYEEGEIRIYKVGAPIIFNTIITLPNDIVSRCFNIVMKREKIIPKKIDYWHWLMLLTQLTKIRIGLYKFRKGVEKIIEHNKEILVKLTTSRDADIFSVLFSFGFFDEEEMAKLIINKIEERTNLETIALIDLIKDNYTQLLAKQNVIIDFENQKIIDAENNAFEYDYIRFDLDEITRLYINEVLKLSDATPGQFTQTFQKFKTIIKNWLCTRLGAKFKRHTVKESGKYSKINMIVFDKNTFFKHIKDIHEDEKQIQLLSSNEVLNLLSDIKNIYVEPL